jgi:hypothetical protein
MMDMPSTLQTNIMMMKGKLHTQWNNHVDTNLFYRAYKVLKRFELSSHQLRQNILKSLSKAGRHWLFIQGEFQLLVMINIVLKCNFQRPKKWRCKS